MKNSPRRIAVSLCGKLPELRISFIRKTLMIVLWLVRFFPDQARLVQFSLFQFYDHLLGQGNGVALRLLSNLAEARVPTPIVLYSLRLLEQRLLLLHSKPFLELGALLTNRCCCHPRVGVEVFKVRDVQGRNCHPNPVVALRCLLQISKHVFLFAEVHKRRIWLRYLVQAIDIGGSCARFGSIEAREVGLEFVHWQIFGGASRMRSCCRGI